MPTARVRLEACKWVRLPGTDLECLLHGKTLNGYQGQSPNIVDIYWSATGPVETGGWRVPFHSYLRKRTAA